MAQSGVPPGMTIRAGGLLPGTTDVLRMPEGQTTTNLGRFQPLPWYALNDYVVAQFAVPTDGLPRATHMTAVVTAEASAGIEVADIVRIDLPANLHRRENIL